MGFDKDYGKALGDSMLDADLASLDGLGMGGEMSDAATDTEDVDAGLMEAEDNIAEAMEDNDDLFD